MALLINWHVAYQLAKRLSELFTEINITFTDQSCMSFQNPPYVVGDDTDNKYCYVEYTLSFSFSQSRTIDWIQYFSLERYEIRRTQVNLTIPAGDSILKLRLCIPYQL